MPAGQRVSRVLLALLAGLGTGLVAGAWEFQGLIAVLDAIAPLGVLWINAVRMTVVPLVVSMLFVSIVSYEQTTILGRQAVTAAVAFIALLGLATLVTWLLAPSLIGDIRVTPETSAALRATVADASLATREQIGQLPGFRDWLISLIPPNPVKAAVDTAMLPLIVVTALFALAARHIDAGQQAALRGFFGGIAQAMTVIVDWVIRLAPIGVFALIAAPAAASGPALVGAIGHYVAAVSVLCFLFTLLLYPIAHTSGVHLALFSRAAIPPQATALASSSSLASLPALLRASDQVGIPRPIGGFILPLAVGTFKIAAPITWTMGTLFIAKLYGVPLDAGATLWVALTAVGLSFSIPGVPQGSLLLLSGVMVSVGVPPEGVALLIAIDAIPDLVATMTNVTGDLVATILVTRFGPEMPQEQLADEQPDALGPSVPAGVPAEARG